MIQNEFAVSSPQSYYCDCDTIWMGDIITQYG